MTCFQPYIEHLVLGEAMKNSCLLGDFINKDMISEVWWNLLSVQIGPDQPLWKTLSAYERSNNKIEDISLNSPFKRADSPDNKENDYCMKGAVSRIQNFEWL